MVGKDIAYGPCHSIEVMQQPRTTRLEDIGTIADVLNVDIHELICHTKVE